jgi:hypothetical protein
MKPPTDGGIVDAALPFFAVTFFKDNLFNI